MDPITFTFPGFRKLFESLPSFSRVPLSTDTVIAFPLTSNKKFSRSIYTPEMTQGRASSDDINQTLTLLEVIFTRTPSKLSLIMSLVFQLVLPFWLLIFIIEEYTYYRFQGPKMILLLFLIYCIIGISYLIYKHRRQMNTAKADIEEVIKIVQPGYLKKGLRWRIPEESRDWIELIKEYHTDVKFSSDLNEAQKSEKAESGYKPPQKIDS